MSPDNPPPLDEAHEVVRALVADRNAGLLDEARCQAEAYALYEKRQDNADRERHFWALRILAEAGLGALSFDDPTVIRSSSKRSEWRALGVALERGKILDLIDGYGRTYDGHMTWEIQTRGYHRVPRSAFDPDLNGETGQGASMLWARARLLAKAYGMPLTELPADPTWIKEQRKREREASRYMAELHEAKRALEAGRKRDETTRLAKGHGGSLERTYGYLRRASQAADQAMREMAGPAYESMEHVLHHLHRAEDEIHEALNDAYIAVAPDKRREIRQGAKHNA